MPWATRIPRKSSGLVSAADENQFDGGIAFVGRFGIGGVKANLPGGRPGACVDSRSQQRAFTLGAGFCLGIKHRLQQLIQVVCGNPPLGQRLFGGDQTLADQIDGDAHGGETGSLCIPRLEHPHVACVGW